MQDFVKQDFHAWKITENSRAKTFFKKKYDLRC